MNESKRGWDLVTSSFQELDTDYELVSFSSDSDQDVSIENITQPVKKYKASNYYSKQNKLLHFSKEKANKTTINNSVNELLENSIIDISSEDDLDIQEILPCASPELSCSGKTSSLTLSKGSLDTNIKLPQKRKRKLVKGGFAAQFDKILKRTKSSFHFWKYERIRGFSEQEELQQDADFLTEEFGRVLVHCKSGDVLIFDPEITPRQNVESSFSMCPTINPLSFNINNKNVNIYLGINKIAPIK